MSKIKKQWYDTHYYNLFDENPDKIYIVRYRYQQTENYDTPIWIWEVATLYQDDFNWDKICGKSKIYHRGVTGGWVED